MLSVEGQEEALVSKILTLGLQPVRGPMSAGAHQAGPCVCAGPCAHNGCRSSQRRRAEEAKTCTLFKRLAPFSQDLEAKFKLSCPSF